MMVDQMPAGATLVIHIGCIKQQFPIAPRGIGLDFLDQDMDDSHAVGDDHGVMGMNMERATIEQLLPGRLDGAGARQALAARMDANRFFIIGPGMHDTHDIAQAQRFVKGLFDLLGAGEDRAFGRSSAFSAHALSRLL